MFLLSPSAHIDKCVFYGVMVDVHVLKALVAVVTNIAGNWMESAAL